MYNNKEIILLIGSLFIATHCNSNANRMSMEETCEIIGECESRIIADIYFNKYDEDIDPDDIDKELEENCMDNAEDEGSKCIATSRELALCFDEKHCTSEECDDIYFDWVHDCD